MKKQLTFSFDDGLSPVVIPEPKPQNFNHKFFDDYFKNTIPEMKSFAQTCKNYHLEHSNKLIISDYVYSSINPLIINFRRYKNPKSLEHLETLYLPLDNTKTITCSGSLCLLTPAFVKVVISFPLSLKHSELSHYVHSPKSGEIFLPKNRAYLTNQKYIIDYPLIAPNMSLVIDLPFNTKFTISYYPYNYIRKNTNFKAL